MSVEESLSLRNRLCSISKNYETYTEPEMRDPRISNGWFLTGWIPFAVFSGGTSVLFTDHKPTENGDFGQVIQYTHDPDSIDYICGNLLDFLERSLTMIKNESEEIIL